MTTLSNEELSLKARALLNEAKKSFTTSFISQMKAAQIIKKIKVCENEYKSHLISLIFLLITANFPLGPWERASLCRCHLICRLHISACWAAPSVPSPRPPLAGACGEAGLLGPPLFWPGRKVRREPWKLESGNIKKNLSHCFIKRQPFTSKHIRNSPLSEAVISNLETLPPQDIQFQFSQQL